MSSRTRTLIDDRLRNRTGSNLADTLAALLADDQSWRTIASHISHITEVPISHETLRQWHQHH